MDEQMYDYCPRCSTRFAQKIPGLLTCGKCGLSFFINPHPCNAVIIENNKGEILLVRRKVDPKKGMWDLPGGFMDINETAEQSVKREIEEELQITLPVFKYVSSYADRYLFGGVNYHTLCFVYAAEVTDPVIKPSDDISSYSFFGKDTIPYEEIAFEGLKTAVREYISQSTQ